MEKRVISIVFSLLLVFSLVSLSGGFDNKLNRKGITNDASDFRDYTRENASKPFSEGGYYGGHDTITAEGMLLKKDVHNNNDFNRWVDQALPSLRTGAHDEDSTKVKVPVFAPPPLPPIPIYYQDVWLDERPIGSTGVGDFFSHFYKPGDKPGTGKGLKGFGTSAPQRAKDYVTEIKKIAGCTPGGIANLQDVNKKKMVYEYFGKSLHLLQDMAVPSHVGNATHAFQQFFPTWGFENYVSNNWESLNKQIVTKDCGLNGGIYEKE